MTIEDFIQTLLPLFPRSANGFSAETEFKKCPEWSSMLTLAIVACVEAEFDVILKSNDFLTATTVCDLFNIAVAKKTTQCDNH